MADLGVLPMQQKAYTMLVRVEASSLGLSPSKGCSSEYVMCKEMRGKLRTRAASEQML